MKQLQKFVKLRSWNNQNEEKTIFISDVVWAENSATLGAWVSFGDLPLFFFQDSSVKNMKNKTNKQTDKQQKKPKNSKKPKKTPTTLNESWHCTAAFSVWGKLVVTNDKSTKPYSCLWIAKPRTKTFENP